MLLTSRRCIAMMPLYYGLAILLKTAHCDNGYTDIHRHSKVNIGRAVGSFLGWRFTGHRSVHRWFYGLMVPQTCDWSFFQFAPFLGFILLRSVDVWRCLIWLSNLACVLRIASLSEQIHILGTLYPRLVNSLLWSSGRWFTISISWSGKRRQTFILA